MSDIIYESAFRFRELEKYEYRFVVSRKRKVQELRLDFRDTDYHHIVGLQYLKDISLPRNRKNIIKNILDDKIITDEVIQKSRFYNNPLHDCDVKSRIEESRFLEAYLDVKNLIYIYSLSGKPYINSQIKADYVIESRLKNSMRTVYILLRRRAEDEKYFGIVSFFRKGTISYGGDALYWMQKEKTCILNGKTETIYQHENYKK